MKIALIGLGRMGKRIQSLAKESGDTVLSVSTLEDPITSDKLKMADVVIDFSSPEATLFNLSCALTSKKPIVIGTTGWEKDCDAAKKLILKEEGRVLFSPNFSIGVFVFREILKNARALLKIGDFDISGLEIHRREKKDAPSGTAKAISQDFDCALDFSSLRVGSIAGIHTLIADGESDTITITHSAKNQDGFAKGALLAAKWLINQPKGSNNGWYTFYDMVRTLYPSHHAL